MQRYAKQLFKGPEFALEGSELPFMGVMRVTESDEDWKDLNKPMLLYEIHILVNEIRDQQLRTGPGGGPGNGGGSAPSAPSAATAACAVRGRGSAGRRSGTGGAGGAGDVAGNV